MKKKKSYRISVFNRTTGKREFMWERYTNQKSAQDIADRINNLDASKVIKAKVYVEVTT